MLPVHQPDAYFEFFSKIYGLTDTIELFFDPTLAPEHTNACFFTKNINFIDFHDSNALDTLADQLMILYHCPTLKANQSIAPMICDPLTAEPLDALALHDKLKDPNLRPFYQHFFRQSQDKVDQRFLRVLALDSMSLCCNLLLNQPAITSQLSQLNATLFPSARLKNLTQRNFRHGQALIPIANPTQATLAAEPFDAAAHKVPQKIMSLYLPPFITAALNILRVQSFCQPLDILTTEHCTLLQQFNHLHTSPMQWIGNEPIGLNHCEHPLTMFCALHQDKPAKAYGMLHPDVQKQLHYLNSPNYLYERFYWRGMAQFYYAPSVAKEQFHRSVYHQSFLTNTHSIQSFTVNLETLLSQAKIQPMSQIEALSIQDLIEKTLPATISHTNSHPPPASASSRDLQPDYVSEPTASRSQFLLDFLLFHSVCNSTYLSTGQSEHLQLNPLILRTQAQLTPELHELQIPIMMDFAPNRLKNPVPISTEQIAMLIEKLFSPIHKTLGPQPIELCNSTGTPVDLQSVFNDLKSHTILTQPIFLPIDSKALNHDTMIKHLQFLAPTLTKNNGNWLHTIDFQEHQGSLDIIQLRIDQYQNIGTSNQQSFLNVAQFDYKSTPPNQLTTIKQVPMNHMFELRRFDRVTAAPLPFYIKKMIYRPQPHTQASRLECYYQENPQTLSTQEHLLQQTAKSLSEQSAFFDILKKQLNNPFLLSLTTQNQSNFIYQLTQLDTVNQLDTHTFEKLLSLTLFLKPAGSHLYAPGVPHQHQLVLENKNWNPKLAPLIESLAQSFSLKNLVQQQTLDAALPTNKSAPSL